MAMIRTAANVCTVLSVRRKIIPVKDRWFRTYVADANGFVDDSYAAQVLDDGHMDLLAVSREAYESCEDIKYIRVVVSTS